MQTIALDAMGGDNAPRVEVAGAIDAVKTGKVRVVLVGDQPSIEAELRRQGAHSLKTIEVHHTSQVITMHDPPSTAVRRKKDASMVVAFKLIKDGQADAVVSAGNSGAMMASALFILKRLRGIDRPAILTTFPTRKDAAVLLDMGANVECRPLNLVQFAIMGASFAQLRLQKMRPKVGLLSNGSEEHKGTALTRETHALLSKYKVEFDYLGYVEGRDIFSGNVDVVVCDGFTGNLVLKVTEGAAETLVAFFKQSIKRSLLSRLIALGLYPSFKQVKDRMDYAEYGGAPLLGVNGVCIICHGGSNEKAIKNALLGAGQYTRSDLAGAINQAIDGHQPIITAAKGHRTVESAVNIGEKPPITNGGKAPAKEGANGDISAEKLQESSTERTSCSEAK